MSTQMSGPGPEEFYRLEAERRDRVDALALGADTTSIRHYVKGLIVFGVASLTVAIVIAYLATMTAIFVALPVFAALLGVLGFLAMRARFARHSLIWVHAGFMLAWTLAFIGTMLLLTSSFSDQVGLFVLGGFLMLLVSLIAAYLAAKGIKKADKSVAASAPEAATAASAAASEPADATPPTGTTN